MAVDWSGAAAAGNAIGSGSADALSQGMTSGIDLGQKLASIHALQGVNLDDPASVNAGVQSSIRAANLEQASALFGLNFKRQQLTSVADFPARLAAAMAGDQSSQPQSAQPAQGQGQPSGPTSDQMAAHRNLMTQARDAAVSLKALPVDQRGAAAEDVKDHFLNHGIPEPAIDAALSDLTDGGLQKTINYYNGVLGAHDAHAAGQPVQLPDHPDGYAWASNLLKHPELEAQAEIYKSGTGMDFTGTFNRAQALVAPFLQKQADVAAAPYLKGVDVAGNVAEHGAVRNIDVNTAGPLAAGEAAGHLAGSSPGTIQTIDMPDGSKMEGTFQPDGNGGYSFRPIKGGEGTGGAGIGHSQSPQAQEAAVGDAKIFNTNYEHDANQASIQGDIRARDLAMAGVKFAQTLKPGNLTPWEAQMSNTLSQLGFGGLTTKANDLATYQSIVAQNLRDSTAQFPRLHNEFSAVQQAVAKDTSPQDAAAISLTETAVMRDRLAQYKQARIQWANDHPGQASERAFQSWWSQQPAASQSMFNSPQFKSLVMSNGKPAVQVYDKPYSDGHTYGVFRPGTPQATVFLVK